MKLPPGSERVARSLLGDGPGTAAQLARRLGVTPTASRRHLDVLVAHGFAYAGDQPPFGPRPMRGRGRPARVFAITDRGRGALEQAYEELAMSTMNFLSSTGAVQDFATHRAAQLEQRLASVTALPQADRPAALVAALTQEGYAASVVESDKPEGLQICQHHCPVSAVAAAFPALCEAETAALGRVLGTHVLRLATIAHGDGVCTTHVPAMSASAPAPTGISSTTRTTSTTSTATAPTSHDRLGRTSA